MKHAHPDKGGDDANIRSIRQHAQLLLQPFLKNLSAQNLSQIFVLKTSEIMYAANKDSNMNNNFIVSEASSSITIHNVKLCARLPSFLVTPFYVATMSMKNIFIFMLRLLTLSPLNS